MKKKTKLFFGNIVFILSIVLAVIFFFFIYFYPFLPSSYYSPGSLTIGNGAILVMFTIASIVVSIAYAGYLLRNKILGRKLRYATNK